MSSGHPPRKGQAQRGVRPSPCNFTSSPKEGGWRIWEEYFMIMGRGVGGGWGVGGGGGNATLFTVDTL